MTYDPARLTHCACGTPVKLQVCCGPCFDRLPRGLRLRHKRTLTRYQASDSDANFDAMHAGNVAIWAWLEAFHGRTGAA